MFLTVLTAACQQVSLVHSLPGMMQGDKAKESMVKILEVLEDITAIEVVRFITIPETTTNDKINPASSRQIHEDCL